jgi:hypothetical protein
VPWKPVVIVAGRLESRSICWIAVTASPSAKPGARLNEIVTAGLLALVVDEQRADRRHRMVTADNGIDCPDGSAVSSDASRQVGGRTAAAP